MTRRTAARPSLGWALLTALALLGAPALPASADTKPVAAAGLAPGTWVRVTTDDEVVGEGFLMTARETRGPAVSHDKRTTTFDVGGQPLRVARPGKTLEGPLRLLDDDKLVLGGPDEKQPIVVPRSDILSLDVRRRESKKGRGLFLGFLGGALVGVAIGEATKGPGCPERSPNGGDFLGGFCLDLEGVETAGDGILGAAAGTLLGLIVAPGARWERGYPLDKGVRVGVRPILGRGAGVSVSLAF